jgi:hypothetical protein
VTSGHAVTRSTKLDDDDDGRPQARQHPTTTRRSEGTGLWRWCFHLPALRCVLFSSARPRLTLPHPSHSRLAHPRFRVPCETRDSGIDPDDNDNAHSELSDPCDDGRRGRRHRRLQPTGCAVRMTTTCGMRPRNNDVDKTARILAGVLCRCDMDGPRHLTCARRSRRRVCTRSLQNPSRVRVRAGYGLV